MLPSLDAIDRQANHMTRPISYNLAEVARVATEGVALDRAPVNLNALLAEAVAEVGVVAPALTLTLTSGRAISISPGIARASTRCCSTCR